MTAVFRLKCFRLIKTNKITMYESPAIIIFLNQTFRDRETLWKRTGRILWLSSSHGKEPWYLPSLSIIITLTAVKKPATLKYDWHSFGEADGQLQTSRLSGRYWPPRASCFLREEAWEGRAKDVRELRISGSSEAAFWWFYLSSLSTFKHAAVIDLDAFIFLQHS